MSKYKIGDRIRFKGEKLTHKITDYNESENMYTTLLEGIGATVIIPDYQIEYTELVQNCEEVELIEPDKDIGAPTTEKIEELVADEINGKSLAEALSIIGGKLNEVIRYINKEE